MPALFTVTVRQANETTEKHFDTLEEAKEYQEGITRAIGRLGRTSITPAKEEEPTMDLSHGFDPIGCHTAADWKEAGEILKAMAERLKAGRVVHGTGYPIRT